MNYTLISNVDFGGYSMQKTGRTLSLMTYNIHKGFGVGKIRFLLPEMRDAIASLNPDFVLLQEVQGAHKRRQKRIDTWPERPQFEYIAQKIWPHYVYAKNAVYDSGHHGNAILSKYPINHFMNLNLSSLHRASRGILHSQLYFAEENVNIHLLCVHLGLFKSERSEQCKRLMSLINKMVPEKEPLLLAGDFNDWRNHLSKPLASELGIKEAFYSVDGHCARSFPAIRPSLCVDRIYFRGLTIQNVQCLEGKPWRMLSDHIPLYASFTIDEFPKLLY